MSDEKDPTEVAGCAEVDVERIAKILGIAAPLVLRRIKDGRLPFRQ